MNLIVFIVRLPWWVHIAIAGLLVYGSISLNNRIASDAAELEAALAAPEPTAIPLELMNDAALGAFDEGRVQAQIDTEETVRLIERTNGVKTKETAMYVLFGPEADADAKTVQAVVMVGERQVDAFADWVVQRMTSFGPRGMVYDIHGEFDSYHSQSDHAREVLEEAGFTVPRNLYFIDPYTEGREAGLREDASGSDDVQLLGFGTAAFFALMGLVKFGFLRAAGGGRKPKRAVPSPDGWVRPDAPMPEHAQAAPAKAGFGLPSFKKAAPEPAPVAEPSAPVARGAGPKASRAAALLAKQEQAAFVATQPAPAKPQSALEKARAFRASVTSGQKSAELPRQDEGRPLRQARERCAGVTSRPSA